MAELSLIRSNWQIWECCHPAAHTVAVCVCCSFLMEKRWHHLEAWALFSQLCVRGMISVAKILRGWKARCDSSFTQAGKSDKGRCLSSVCKSCWLESILLHIANFGCLFCHRPVGIHIVLAASCASQFGRIDLKWVLRNHF